MVGYDHERVARMQQPATQSRHAAFSQRVVQQHGYAGRRDLYSHSLASACEALHSPAIWQSLHCMQHSILLHAGGNIPTSSRAQLDASQPLLVCPYASNVAVPLRSLLYRV